jgi:hypothetical protein
MYLRSSSLSVWIGSPLSLDSPIAPISETASSAARWSRASGARPLRSTDEAATSAASASATASALSISVRV